MIEFTELITYLSDWMTPEHILVIMDKVFSLDTHQSEG